MKHVNATIEFILILLIIIPISIIIISFILCINDITNNEEKKIKYSDIELNKIIVKTKEIKKKEYMINNEESSENFE